MIFLHFFPSSLLKSPPPCGKRNQRTELKPWQLQGRITHTTTCKRGITEDLYHRYIERAFCMSTCVMLMLVYKEYPTLLLAERALSRHYSVKMWSSKTLFLPSFMVIGLSHALLMNVSDQ